LFAPYASTKAAVTGWTRTLQAEWADTEIKVSEYFPGYIATGSPSSSKYGEVPQDVFADPESGGFLRSVMKAQSPEHVAAQIARLIEKPKPLMCSNAGVAMGTWLSNIAWLRKKIGTEMGKAARKRLGLKIFSEDISKPHE
jgi:NAD(P)-dependent dehydrogenase (short-subunit alcohol dehydrogenase family)